MRRLPPNASNHWSLAAEASMLPDHHAKSRPILRMQEPTGTAAGTFDLLLVVLAQHAEKSKLGRFRQKFIVALKPGLLIRQFQMNVEIPAGSPILIEVKYIGIILANVKMIVDAAGLGPRSTDKTAQKFNKFGTLFWSGVQSSCEGATWFHNFLGLPFHHAANVHAMWFFNARNPQ
jgi:hypothetical protein